jgi:tetratricopeptide (TPR) repeat protein
VVFVGCLVAQQVALAEPGSYADAKEAAVQFQRGRALFKEAKYAPACAAFARSQQLDPQSGTLYNLASCYVERGLLVSAWNAYRDLADHDKNPKRREDSAQRAAALEARLPKLQITAPSGWKVTMNGVDVSGLVDRARPVDPGAYEIVGTRPGHATFRTTVTVVDDGKTSVVAIRSQVSELADPFGSKLAELPRPVVTAHPAPPDRARTRLRSYALMTTIGGAALFASGLGFGKLASDRWSEAKQICGGDLTCSTADDIARANALGDRARSRAHAATAFVLAGTAVAGVGVWLYWKSSRTERAIQVSPGAGTTLGGVTLEGRF